MNEIYIAIISKITSDTERVTFSEVTNYIVEQHGELNIEEASFNSFSDIGNHILGKWLDSIKNKGWWMPWMNEATEITWYTGTYGDEEI
ncbi:MAG: hypothetical protein M0R80_09715 [Proteobacteria bacterium]|nr:hypothetical protein [Pseudomonadota bacterium]